MKKRSPLFIMARSLCFAACFFWTSDSFAISASAQIHHNTFDYAYAPAHYFPSATHFVCRAGDLCSKKMGNGDSERFGYGYDKTNNPYSSLDKIGLFDSHNRLEAELNYSYDKTGRVTEQELIVISTGQRETQHNLYDAEGNLILQVRTDDNDDAMSVTRFAYDANRNIEIKQSTAANGIGKYDFYGHDGLDRLSTVDGNPEYDLYNRRDALLRDEYGNVYGYDTQSRTIDVSTADGDDYAYRYLAGTPALRFEKKRTNRDDQTRPASDPSLFYYYEGTGEDSALLSAVEPHDGTAHYLLGTTPEERAVTDRDGTHGHYLFEDRADSVLGETDDAGELTHMISYHPYGRQRILQSSYEDPFDLNRPLRGFQGNPQDAETGNGYNETRYNKGDGTWTTQDSVMTMNRIEAFDGDPINNRDDPGRLAQPMRLLTALPSMIESGTALLQADSGEETAKAALDMAANFSTVAGAIRMATSEATHDSDMTLSADTISEDPPLSSPQEQQSENNAIGNKEIVIYIGVGIFALGILRMMFLPVPKHNDIKKVLPINIDAYMQKALSPEQSQHARQKAMETMFENIPPQSAPSEYKKHIGSLLKLPQENFTRWQKNFQLYNTNTEDMQAYQENLEYLDTEWGSAFKDIDINIPEQYLNKIKKLPKKRAFGRHNTTNAVKVFDEKTKINKIKQAGGHILTGLIPPPPDSSYFSK